MSAEQPAPVPGPEISGHTWVRHLGSGGFADVHLYDQHVPARPVAIKILRNPGDARGRAALTREADAMARVSGHPSVVSLFDVGTLPEGSPYLVMEYCPVANLADQIRVQPMAVPRALEFLVQVCAGVETLHREGLVHGDIKPANIMGTAWGRPVLTDFGVCHPIGALPEGEDGGFSVFWAPPEQQSADAATHPTMDVWSLAATGWALLAGRSPFEDPLGDNGTVAVAARVRQGRLGGLGRGDVPAELEAALRAGMELAPGRRTQSAAILAEQLRAAQRALHLPPTPFEVSERVGLHQSLGIDDNRTRQRSFPDLGGAATRQRPAAPDAEPPPATPPAVAERPGEVARGRGTWTVALLVVAAVLLTAGVVAAALLRQGATIKPAPGVESVKPMDPVGAPPRPVSRVTGQVKNGRVYWTWVPDPAGGQSRFQYRVSRQGMDDITRDTTLSAVDVQAVRGRMCLEIVAVAKDGRASTPAETCLDVP